MLDRTKRIHDEATRNKNRGNKGHQEASEARADTEEKAPVFFEENEPEDNIEDPLVVEEESFEENGAVVNYDEFFNEDDRDEPRPKQKKKQKEKQKESSDSDGIVDKFKQLPTLWKGVVVVFLVFAIMMIMELRNGGGQTGDQNLTLSPEQNITAESVSAEDNKTSAAAKAISLDSCIMANPLSFKADQAGVIKAFAGAIDLSGGQTFCDEFQAGQIAVEESNGGIDYVLQVMSNGAEVAKKRTSLIDSMQPTYYLEGIEALSPTGGKNVYSIGDSLVAGFILVDIKQSQDGMNVIYSFTYNGKPLSIMIPRATVL